MVIAVCEKGAETETRDSRDAPMKKMEAEAGVQQTEDVRRAAANWT
jgi:hypothetical protein